MDTPRALPIAESIPGLLDAYVKVVYAPASMTSIDVFGTFPMGTTMAAMKVMLTGMDTAGCSAAELQYKFSFADVAREGENRIRLTFITTPPAESVQATYNYEVSDGDTQDEWPRCKQTFVLLRTGAGSYTKGMAVTAPPAESGTGWVRTGEHEQKIPQERLHALFVVFEVHYSATAQVRTDYKFNDETRTLNAVVTSWVSTGAAAPTYSAGTSMQQKQISALWSLRTVETQGAIPAASAQAAYSTEYIDGANESDPWIRAQQTFYVTIGAGEPVVAVAGMNRTGSRKIPILDKAIEGLLERWEVYWAATDQSRTSYKFNPETGTLITTVVAWVANTAGAPPVPTQGSGVIVTQAQISYAWSLRTTETHATLTGYMLAVPSRVNLNLPDVLEDVSVEWQDSSEEGSSDSDWVGNAAGTTVTLSATEDGTAESSASMIPELVVRTRQSWGHNIPSTLYYMIMEKVSGIITEAAVSAKLNSLYGLTTVNNWPVFHPKTFVVALAGGKVSVQAGVRANEHVSYSAASSNYSLVKGNSKRVDVSHTTGTRVIPNVLCAGFNIQETRNRSVNATGHIAWPNGSGWIGVDLTKSADGSIDAFVKGQFAPTEPPSIPSAGYYLVNLQSRPFQNLAGFMMVVAEVIDAASLT